MTMKRWFATTCLATALVLSQSAGVMAQARNDGDRYGHARHDQDRDGRDGRDGRDRARDNHDGRDRGRARDDHRGRRGDRDRNAAHRPDHRPAWQGRVWHGPAVGHPPHRKVYPNRVRHYRKVIVVRPHGHWYRGYGHYHRDDAAYAFLAFTAITLVALNFLSVSQQRAHEDAQIRATTAPVGETVYWRDGNASGGVTTLRDGYTASGRYCREFQQTVVIAGRTEQAYGTACQQPDGSWQIVDTRS